MKVLLVTPRIPYPKDRGGEIALAELIEHLPSEVEIDLAALVDEAEPEGMAEAEKRFGRVVRASRRGKWSPLIVANMCAGTPYAVARHAAPTLRKLIDKASNEVAYDVVHVLHYYMVQNVPHQLLPRTLLMVQNVHTDWFRGAAAATTSNAARWLYRREARCTASHERRALEAVASAVAISTVDSDGLTRIASENPPCKGIHAVEVGFQIRAEGTGVHQESGAKGADVVFIGSMNYPPNEDGGLFLLKDIWPKVIARRPGTRLEVVGRSPSSRLRRMARAAGVRCTGYVESIADYVRSARVGIVPIRFGSGVRIKILDYLAYGLPVVSTAAGAEGLELRDGEHILLAATPGDFAMKILWVLNNPEAADEMVNRAQRHLVTRGSWADRGQEMANLYHRVAR